MSSATELTLTDELLPLEEIATHRGWRFERREGSEFVLGMQARDESWFWLLCRCDRYPGIPPAWHWYHPEVGGLDRPQYTPKGGQFFHGHGVICAPWNRLAYKSEDPRGPHGDWSIGNWKANPRTGECKTLAAMALRIFTELRRETFIGRMG